MKAPQINPAFWIQAIRTNAHVTDCAEKTQALRNAADHLEQYIAALAAPKEAGEKWSADVVALLTGFGFAPEAATVFASAELAEYRSGECDCAELAPDDIVDLLMDVARGAVEKWKVESVGRPYGFKDNRLAAPSKEAGHVRSDGSDWLDYAVTPAEHEQRARHFANPSGDQHEAAPQADQRGASPGGDVMRKAVKLAVIEAEYPLRKYRPQVYDALIAALASETSPGDQRQEGEKPTRIEQDPDGNWVAPPPPEAAAPETFKSAPVSFKCEGVAVGDVVVSRADIEHAAQVCDSWQQMHSEYVRVADIERWEYPPGVEGLAESLRAALASPTGVDEWTDAQCDEFLAVAFRHCHIDGTLHYAEIRQGQQRANALAARDGGANHG